MDFQTIGDLTTVSGGYAYVVSGFDNGGAPQGIGGVFSTDGAGGFSNDSSDRNDDGTVTLNDSGQGGSFTAPDPNGRGTATIGALGFAYYQVGPEALYMVETDGTQLLVGEALGQGGSTGAFAPASLGPAAFGANGFTIGFASIAGQFTADGTSAFTGFSDANEDAAVISTGSTSGTYTLAANGYGNFTITGGDFLTGTGDITTFGMYAIDPALNVNDPNNPNGAAGGAFLLNLDSDAVMTGVLATQSDATDVFQSNNAISFGGADDTEPVDLVGQYLSDGVSSFTGTADENLIFVPAQNQGVPLAGTFAADPNNPGRSTRGLNNQPSSDSQRSRLIPGESWSKLLDRCRHHAGPDRRRLRRSTVDNSKPKMARPESWPRHFYFRGSPIPKNVSLKQTRSGSARRPNYLHPCPQCRGSHSFT